MNMIDIQIGKSDLEFSSLKKDNTFPLKGSKKNKQKEAIKNSLFAVFEAIVIAVFFKNTQLFGSIIDQ